MKKVRNDAAAGPAEKEIIPYIIIAVVTAATFAGSLGLSFLADWDDSDHIVSNFRLAFSLEHVLYWFSHDMVAVYMPFTMLSYMFDYAVWGLNPLGFRITSLLLHIIAAWGVYKCFRYFRISTVAAVMFSLLFAVHPQRVESVIWMSERKDVLCAAFYFWSAFFYLRGLEKGWKSRIPAFLLFAGALLSKPMAVSLPFVFLCMEFNYRRDFKIMYYLKRIGPFLATALVMMVVTLFTQKVTSNGETDFVRQIMVVLHNVYWYVVTMFIPVDLMPIYPRIFFDIPLLCRMGLFYLVVIIGICRLAVVAGRDKMIFDVFPLIAAGLFALAPVVGIFSLGHTDYADRYFYIPSAFVLLMVALLGKMIFKSAPAKNISVRKCLILVWVGIMVWYVSYDQSLFKHWSSSYALGKRSTQPEYCNELPLYGICFHAYNRGKYDEVADAVKRLRGFEQMERYRGNRATIKANYLLAEAKLYLVYGNKKASLTAGEELLPILRNKEIAKRHLRLFVTKELFFIELKLNNIKVASELVDLYLSNYDGSVGEDSWYYYFSGMKAAFKGDYETAAENFKKILEQYPGDKVAEANYRRAMQMLESKRKQ